MLAQQAWAGCGTMITANTTSQWAWVTIYNVGKTIQHDYGWVKPHSVRTWTGGASISYACGSFYTVRYEMKKFGAGSTTPPTDTTNLADTTKDINPQIGNWPMLIADLVKEGVTCAASELAGCAIKWGISTGVDQAVFGNDAVGNVTCVKTPNNSWFYVEESRNCVNPPKASPPQYSIQLVGQKILPGYNPRTYVFRVISGGHTMGSLAGEGIWSSTNPAIVKIEGKMGNFRALKPGRATVSWEYNKRKYSGDMVVVAH